VKMNRVVSQTKRGNHYP